MPYSGLVPPESRRRRKFYENFTTKNGSILFWFPPGKFSFLLALTSLNSTKSFSHPFLHFGLKTIPLYKGGGHYVVLGHVLDAPISPLFYLMISKINSHIFKQTFIGALSASSKKGVTSPADSTFEENFPFYTLSHTIQCFFENHR